MSCVTCLMSHVTCHIFLIYLLFFGQSCQAFWWRSSWLLFSWVWPNGPPRVRSTTNGGHLHRTNCDRTGQPKRHRSQQNVAAKEGSPMSRHSATRTSPSQTFPLSFLSGGRASKMCRRAVARLRKIFKDLRKMCTLERKIGKTGI